MLRNDPAKPSSSPQSAATCGSVVIQMSLPVRDSARWRDELRGVIASRAVLQSSITTRHRDAAAMRPDTLRRPAMLSSRPR